MEIPKTLTESYGRKIGECPSFNSPSSFSQMAKTFLIWKLASRSLSKRIENDVRIFSNNEGLLLDSLGSFGLEFFGVFLNCYFLGGG